MSPSALVFSLWRQVSANQGGELRGGQVESTLLEPFGHTLPDLFLTDEFATVRLLEPSFDSIEQVEPIQRVFDAGIVR